MKNIDVWLYRYIAIRANHVLTHVSAMLGAMTPSPVYRPALQCVRTPMSPSIDDIRRRSDVLTPLI